MKEKIIFDTKEKITDFWIVNSNVKLLSEWTLFMSFKISIWKLAFAWKNLYTNEAIAWLPIKNPNELNKNFLYYVLLWYEFWKTWSDNSVKWATLNKEKLKQIQIPLPPLPTQQKIVSKLDSLFEKLDQAITLTKQNLANIEELNKSVLEKIFANDKWERKKLWEICEIKTWKKDANYSTDDWKYPFFTCWREILKSPWYSFDTDAILIAWNWDVWACKKFKWKFEAYQRTYVLDNFQNIEKNFLFYFLDWNLKKELLNETLWSAIPYIKLWSLQNREIPLPPLSEQQKIVEYLDNIFAKNKILQDKFKQDLQNLEELKHSILKQAFENEDFIK